MSGAAATASAGSSGAPYQSQTPGPTRSRNNRASGSLISGSLLSVSAARAAATPRAVAPTLSVISQLSSSVLATTRPYVSRRYGRITVTMTSTSRRPHIIRLAVFAAFLVVMFYLLAVKHVVNIEDVRHWVKATGPLAPLTYIVLSAVLGAIFVPGPILGASRGPPFRSV